MDIEQLARKLEPLMPDRIAHWRKSRDLADPDTKALLDKHLLQLAHKTLGDYRNKPLLSLPPEKLARRPIHLGTVIYERDKWPFGISTSELLQNLAIFGRSGAGKTNVAFHLLEQLAGRKIPFLFLDWKRTARHLLPNLKGKINIYTPGRSLSPFAFNPFISPPELEPSVYINQLIDVMAEAYTLGDGARSIMQRSLAAVYDRGSVPTVENVLAEVDRLPVKGRASQWKISAVRALESLRFASLTTQGTTSQEVMAKQLLHENTIIELDALGSGEKKFLVPLLCSWLYTVKLASPVREKLSLVIFIEEAHHVLYRAERRSSETLMNTLLRQCREVGIACVVVDQHPHLISSAALGNTYTSICLNLKDPADINRAAALSLLEDGDQRVLSKLPVGQGVVKLQDRWRQPVLVKFPLVAVAKGSVSDAVLSRYLHRKSTGTRGINRRDVEFARVSRVLDADDPLKADELAFLKDVMALPDDGVKARYLRLGWSIGRGNAVKVELLRRGWLDSLIVPHGRTRKLILRLTRGANDALGADYRNGHHQSLAHEYWKRFYARRYESMGYAVELEAPRNGGHVDVIASNGDETIAIEIETGMSDAVANVRCDLRAGFQRVLVVATDEKAMVQVERELAKSGLLIRGRVMTMRGSSQPC